MGDTGFEPVTHVKEKTTSSDTGGAVSGAPAAPTPLDPDLVGVLTAWPSLPTPIRAAITAMVRAATGNA
jgi:hypothetical protein